MADKTTLDVVLQIKATTGQKPSFTEKTAAGGQKYVVGEVRFANVALSAAGETELKAAMSLAGAIAKVFADDARHLRVFLEDYEEERDPTPEEQKASHVYLHRNETLRELASTAVADGGNRTLLCTPGMEVIAGIPHIDVYVARLDEAAWVRSWLKTYLGLAYDAGKKVAEQLLSRTQEGQAQGPSHASKPFLAEELTGRGELEMSGKYLTTITFKVLSDRPLDDLDDEDVLREADGGDMVATSTREAEAISDERCKELLIEFGSEPAFFFSDDDETESL
jgi:hypothetical protein